MFLILATLALTVISASADPGFAWPTITVDARTGLPIGLTGADMLPAGNFPAPPSLVVRENDTDRGFAPLQRTDERFEATDKRLGLTISAVYGKDPASYVEFTVINQRDEARKLTLALVIPVWPDADRAFFPAGTSPHVQINQDAEPVKYGYPTFGHRLAMPLGQVYNPDEDWGLAFFEQLGLLVEPMRFEVTRTQGATTVEIGLPLSLEPGQNVTRRIYLAATRGDWRPALGAILNAFPKAFEPQNPAVKALHGPFAGGGVRSDEAIQSIYDQGCRVVEIHSWSPFYGEYVPTQEIWTPFCDDRWHYLKKKLSTDQLPPEDSSWQELRVFVEQQYPPTMTVAKLNDYIARLHAHNIKGLMYFNPTEAWAPWAAAMFPDDRRLDSDGNPIPAWYESSSMIPDKDRPWGKYLLDQIRGELKTFPKVDGIFFDQSAGGGHDLTLLCAEACNIVRKQGKICWWNGPYNMELAALADGMMTEGGGMERYRINTEIIHYYGIAGKPIVSLGPATEAGYAEMLVHGIIPKPINTSSAQDKALADRWSPLFAWLKNYRWALEPHALEVAGDIRANLLRLPDGNLVAPIVTNDYRADEISPTLDASLTVRVPEAEHIRAAYLMLPDLIGYHRLAIRRDGEALTIVIPRIERAGLLVLATGGTFAALDGPLYLVRGATST
ncbi:MAG: hypothetical protein J7M38_02360, partial [Armatimonadetes bacterium]|nr:hypothetical protein [Armatimonadota bacterium]